MTLLPKPSTLDEPLPERRGADDLFTWLDAIWNKQQPNGTFPVFVAHRFLASDRELAPVARILSKDIRDPAMVFATWQALLPEAPGAPRLTYPAAKKRPEAEELTQRMMAVLGVRRGVAEEMQELIKKADRIVELYAEFGVKWPGADEVETFDGDDRPKRKKAKGPVGLMAQIARK